MARIRALSPLHRATVVGVLLLGSAAGPGPEAATGPAFELRPSVALPCAETVARGGGFTLTARGPDGCPACLCSNLIFDDGFESGDAGAWSSTVP